MQGRGSKTRRSLLGLFASQVNLVRCIGLNIGCTSVHIGLHRWEIQILPSEDPKVDQHGLRWGFEYTGVLYV